MKSVGAAVRVSKGRYSAALILIYDAVVVQQVPLPAPTASGHGRLSELYQRTRDFVAETQPDLFALKVFEGQAGKDEARRAEGAVLAGAASQSGVRISLLFGSGMWVPAGRPKPRTNAVVVGALCDKLDTEVTGKELRDAAAAGLAAILKAGK